MYVRINSWVFYCFSTATDWDWDKAWDKFESDGYVGRIRADIRAFENDRALNDKQIEWYKEHLVVCIVACMSVFLCYVQ